ncbi:MAG: MFS transporter, partial [Sinobacteraceae bacterium]|nr:MFS transporter [Nevskiaceae bacterium]
AACGMAQSYLQLFMARVGVGVGEAALSPSALSLISDYFAPERRGRAIAFYTSGISLGSGLAMIIGGPLIALVGTVGRTEWPLVGELYGWQKVFILVGLPGLLMALLMFTVREPARREQLVVQGQGRSGAAALSFAEVFRFLLARWKLYGSHFVGLSVTAMLTYGFLAWVPQTFVRTWGWSIPRIGIVYGVVTLISGGLSVLLVSVLARRFEAQGRTDVYMRTALWSFVLGAVGAVLVPLAPNPEFAVLMLVPMSTGTIAATGAGLTALMVVTPNQMRAQTSACYYFVVNLLGLTIGPTGIALFTDYVFRDDRMLRWSVLSVATLSGIVAISLLIYNLRQYRQAIAEAGSWTERKPAPTA